MPKVEIDQRGIRIDGKRIPIVSDEEAEKADAVVCGGESGTGARPMHPDWARSLRDQCAAAGVPFFFKQWGSHRPTSDVNGEYMIPASKREAGRLLDGRMHDAMPQVRL